MTATQIFLIVNKLELREFDFNVAVWIAPEVFLLQKREKNRLLSVDNFDDNSLAADCTEPISQIELQVYLM